MRISDVIAGLKKVLEEEGDLCVFIEIEAQDENGNQEIGITMISELTIHETPNAVEKDLVIS